MPKMRNKKGLAIAGLSMAMLFTTSNVLVSAADGTKTNDAKIPDLKVEIQDEGGFEVPVNPGMKFGLYSYPDGKVIKETTYSSNPMIFEDLGEGSYRLILLEDPTKTYHTKTAKEFASGQSFVVFDEDKSGYINLDDIATRTTLDDPSRTDEDVIGETLKEEAEKEKEVEQQVVTADVTFQLADAEKKLVEAVTGMKVGVYEYPSGDKVYEGAFTAGKDHKIELPVGSYRVVLLEDPSGKYQTSTADKFKDGTVLLVTGVNRAVNIPLVEKAKTEDAKQDLVDDATDKAGTDAKENQTPATTTTTKAAEAKKTGTGIVYVASNNGVPFTNTAVVIKDKAKPTDFYTVATNEAGEATFNVPVGEYTIELKHPLGTHTVDEGIGNLVIKEGEEAFVFYSMTVKEEAVNVIFTKDGGLIDDRVEVRIQGIDKYNDYIDFKGKEGNVPNAGSIFHLPYGKYKMSIAAGLPEGYKVEDEASLEFTVDATTKELKFNLVPGKAGEETTKPATPATGGQTTTPTEPATGGQTTEPATGGQTTEPTQPATGGQTTEPTQPATGGDAGQTTEPKEEKVEAKFTVDRFLTTSDVKYANGMYYNGLTGSFINKQLVNSPSHFDIALWEADTEAKVVGKQIEIPVRLPAGGYAVSYDNPIVPDGKVYKFFDVKSSDAIKLPLEMKFNAVHYEVSISDKGDKLPENVKYKVTAGSPDGELLFEGTAKNVDGVVKFPMRMDPMDIYINLVDLNQYVKVEKTYQTEIDILLSMLPTGETVLEDKTPEDVVTGGDTTITTNTVEQPNGEVVVVDDEVTTGTTVKTNSAIESTNAVEETAVTGKGVPTSAMSRINMVPVLGALAVLGMAGIAYTAFRKKGLN